MRTRTGLAGLGVVLALALASGCGGTVEAASGPSATSSPAAEGDRTVGTSVCLADAKPLAGALPAGFPTDFPFPDSSVVYGAQDRGAAGVVVTAVTAAPLKDVLAALNGPAQQAGYKVTSGETEDHDAEADWSGNGFKGRWAIKESATCTGEVSIQVLARKG